MTKKLSEAKLKTLEEDYRAFNTLPSKMITALFNSQYSVDDINSWIKGSREQPKQEALDMLIKKEDTPAFQLNLLKYKAIERAYKQLPHELQQIVIKYMWGKYSYLKWGDIASREHCSKSTIYEWRYKILENYAYELGELI